MKKLITIVLMALLSVIASAYPRLSILERYTNAGCAPCASLNNAWYTNATQNMVASGLMTHLVYNVDWPQATDPMFLLNSADNNIRRGVYAVNSVPWLTVNGSTISGTQAALEAAVNSGNTIFSPFRIVVTPELFSNNVVNVNVKVYRDPADVTVFNKTRLFIALTEKTVAYASPPGSNGESVFYSISRKMLPDGKGTEFPVPAAGDSVEMDFVFVPSASFTGLVNMDSLRILSFIQSMDSKYIHQSVSADIKRSTRINAAMQATVTLGAAPFTVNFTDFSTGAATGTINSWQWDFNNDGTVDETTQNPSYVYTGEGAYTVKLTVSDGTNSHTRILSNYINVIEAHSDILVVNGIEYATYPAEMANFYNNSAGFGEHEVDIWDLFGDQGFDYKGNTLVKKANYFNRSVPMDVLKLYPRVLWFGNNYGGDYVFWNAQQALDYVTSGGNFLIATRQGADFLTSPIMTYCGIQSMTGLVDITSALLPLHDSLASMTPLASNTRNQMVTLSATSEAVPIFDDNNSTAYIAGFRIKKDSAGTFIYIAGRPYRFDNVYSAYNYNAIINNWMTYTPVVGVKDQTEAPSAFSLEQNYPNPFNPSTKISYSLPSASQVTLKIYDILGNELAVPVNGSKPAGVHSVSFDAGRLCSGVYIYRLSAYPVSGGSGSVTLTRKMILTK